MGSWRVRVLAGACVLASFIGLGLADGCGLPACTAAPGLVNSCGSSAPVEDSCRNSNAVCFCDGYEEGVICPGYASNCLEVVTTQEPVNYQNLKEGGKGASSSSKVITVSLVLLITFVVVGFVLFKTSVFFKGKRANEIEQRRLEDVEQRQRDVEAAAAKQRRVSQEALQAPVKLILHALQSINSLGSIVSLKRQQKSSSSLAAWDAPHETDAEFKEIEQEQDVALFEVLSLEQKVERDGYIVGMVADDDYMIVLDTREEESGDDVCDGWTPSQQPSKPVSVVVEEAVEVEVLTAAPPRPQSDKSAMVGLTTNVFNPDSVYNVGSIGNPRLRLNVSDGNSQNGYRDTNVQVWDVTHEPAHAQWQFLAQPDGTYTVVNCHSGKVLSVDLGSTESGANIVICDDVNQSNQRFQVALRGAGYTLQAVCSGKYIALENEIVASTVNGVVNGTDVRQMDDPDSSGAQWAIVADELNLSRVVPLSFDDTAPPKLAAAVADELRSVLQAAKDGNEGAPKLSRNARQSLRTILRAGPTAVQQVLQENSLLEYFDADGDGNLTVHEMKAMDTNGDGRVSFEELIDAVVGASKDAAMFDAGASLLGPPSGMPNDAF